MNYGNIPTDILNKVLGQNFFESEDKFKFTDYTLKVLIDEIGEDIMCAEWLLDNNDKNYNLIDFTAWTKNNILILTDTTFGDKLLKVVSRNPIKM